MLLQASREPKDHFDFDNGLDHLVSTILSRLGNSAEGSYHDCTKEEVPKKLLERPLPPFDLQILFDFGSPSLSEVVPFRGFLQQMVLLGPQVLVQSLLPAQFVLDVELYL